MIVQTRGGGQTGHGLRHLGVLGLAEPDGRGGGVGLGDCGVDHVLPPRQIHELAGQLVHGGRDDL